MNGLTRKFHKPDADKVDAASSLQEVRALRGEVSEGLGAIRLLLAAMLAELKKEKP